MGQLHFCVLLSVLPLPSCSTVPNRYESASANEIAAFKPMPIPLPKGAETRVRQGAFGASSHSEPGNEYSWDFEVAFGTPVMSAKARAILSLNLQTIRLFSAFGRRVWFYDI